MIPRTPAARLQILMELLGGQPLVDENGCILMGEDGKPILSAELITKEEALKLLELPSPDPES